MILPPELIFEKVQEVTGVTREQLLSKSRLQQIAHARFLLNYFMKQYCNLTLKEIGKQTYGMDHTSVLHSIKTVTQAVQNPHTGYDKIVYWYRVLSPKFMNMRRHYRDYTGKKIQEVKWVKM